MGESRFVWRVPGSVRSGTDTRPFRHGGDDRPRGEQNCSGPSQGAQNPWMMTIKRLETANSPGANGASPIRQSKRASGQTEPGALGPHGKRRRATRTRSPVAEVSRMGAVLPYPSLGAYVAQNGADRDRDILVPSMVQREPPIRSIGDAPRRRAVCVDGCFWAAGLHRREGGEIAVSARPHARKGASTRRRLD